MVKLAQQPLGNNTGGDRATAGGVKRPRAQPMQHWNGLPRGCMANTLLCQLTAARPSTLPARLRALLGEWKEIAEHLRMRHLLGRSPPSMLQEVASVDFQLGMFQFCGHNSLGFVLVLYVYNCNMSHSKLKPIYRLCPARLRYSDTLKCSTACLCSPRSLCRVLLKTTLIEKYQTWKKMSDIFKYSAFAVANFPWLLWHQYRSQQ